MSAQGVALGNIGKNMEFSPVGAIQVVRRMGLAVCLPALTAILYRPCGAMRFTWFADPGLRPGLTWVGPTGL